MATSSKRRKVDRSMDLKHEDTLLLRDHKIFLSHSGVQKEFVEQLCVDLESRHRFPFFDKRSSSLPKGERFPILIKAALAQCKMMVVVVSNEYFTSKWPMIELNGFMQATKEDPTLKILPLFYGLNVEEFSDDRIRKLWFKEWETMAKADDRIKLGEWKESLKLFGAFNGLVYERHSKEVGTYRKEIVSNICKAIPSDIKYDESHVQGRSKLCKVIRGYFENIPHSTKIPGVCVIGLYGLGGMGKTQICKIMCNELDGDFDGRVCHVELGKQSKHELVKKALTTLTITSAEVVQEVGEDKCGDILVNDKNWKLKSFLTIDNVWDDYDSLEQGKLFLRAPFVEGSWVIITSRFRKTLISLNVDESACFEMPELDKDDAREMFLHYATNGKIYENREDVNAIEECIKSCYVGKGEGRGSHYHPLSLKALGIFLQYGREEPSVWMKDLQKLKESSYSQEPINPLFKILRSNFDRLPKWEQELFMDVALFSPPRIRGFKLDLMVWLCLVHNKEKEVIENWLRHLVDSALLEHAEMSSGEVSIHDLYREFATLEGQGKLKALDMEERRWVYAGDAIPTELVEEPSSNWKLLTRVFISKTYKKMNRSWIMNLRTIEWKYCTNLVVLKLDANYEFIGVLNFKDLIRLRSLTVETTSELSAFRFSIKGLEGPKFLTYFKIVADYSDREAYVGQLPASLMILVVDASVVFERDFLALCTNLVSLKLSKVYTANLDFRSCASLQNVELANIHPLEISASKLSIEGLEGLKILTYFKIVCDYGHREPYVGQLPASLKVLQVEAPVVFERDFLALCTNLVSLKLSKVTTADLDLRSCASLQNVVLAEIQGLEIVTLGPSLQSLYIRFCQQLVEVCGSDRLVGLLSLDLTWNRKLSKLPSLSGLKRLHTLTCYWSEIDEVPGLDGLVGLQSLSLSNWPQLSKLPSDLTGLQCLRELCISDLGGITEIPNLSGLEQLQVIHASLNRQLTSLQGLGDLRALTALYLSSCESLCRLSDMRKLANLKVLDLQDTGVEFHEEDIHMLEGLQALEPVLAGSIDGEYWYGLDFKRHKIMRLFRTYCDYHGWETLQQLGWEEKDLHYRYVVGYLVGKGFGIRDVQTIWRLIPGPTTKIEGIKRFGIWIWNLKALGIFLQYGGKGPLVWMKDLQKLKESSYSQEPVNPLFKILKSNFDRLPNWEQELFMDVALFSPPRTDGFELDLMEWLCLVHNIDKEVIEDWLWHLVDSALLEHAEMSSGEVSIHDLYREFATLEAQGKLKALDMEERRWLYARDALPTELVEEQRSSWKLLTRVCIAETYKNMNRSWITSLRTIGWKYCTNLVVLKLGSMYDVCGVLNFKDLIRLRSLTVEIAYGLSESRFSIHGLEGLKSLTYFKLLSFGCTSVGELPAALKVLEVDSSFVFERDILALCTNLVSLKLKGVTADLDLKSCASLQNVEFAYIHPLGISASKLSIEGLEGLKSLTYFKMVCGHGDPEAFVGQLPTSLKVLQVEAPVVFEQDFLALCTNLLSLKLMYVKTSDMDLKRCASLQNVELAYIHPLEISASRFAIEDLEGLKNLAYFKMVCGHGDPEAFVGQLPTSLKVLEVEAHVVFERDFLALCTNLVSLKLMYVNTSKVDFRICTSLQNVELAYIHPLEISASRFAIEGLEGLKSLTNFKMVCGHGDPEAFVGQLLASLKVLEVEAPVVFERDFLALCTNLVSLKLMYVNTSDMDLRICTSLQNVELAYIHPLEISATKLSIAGLEGLKSLTNFKMVCGHGDPEAFVGQLPASLKVLQVEAPVVFEQDFLALCTNLVSLKLMYVTTSDMDLRICLCLHNVEFAYIHPLEIYASKLSIAGLDGLKSLTNFKMVFDHGDPEAFVGQLPASLKVLEVEAHVVFEWDFLALCTKLVSLKLMYVNTSDMDLRICTSLQNVELAYIHPLGISASKLSIEGLEGSEGLKSLTNFKMVCGHGDPEAFVGQLPESLKVLEVEAPVVFERDFLALCTTLVWLGRDLYVSVEWRAESVDEIKIVNLQD